MTEILIFLFSIVFWGVIYHFLIIPRPAAASCEKRRSQFKRDTEEFKRNAEEQRRREDQIQAQFKRNAGY